jgi:hypothetical protein
VVITPRVILPPSSSRILPFHRLEARLLRWLCELDLVSTHEAAGSFAAVLPALEDGVLLCEAVAAAGAVAVPGVTERPLAPAARASNIGLALRAARGLPGMVIGCGGEEC